MINFFLDLYVARFQILFSKYSQSGEEKLLAKVSRWIQIGQFLAVYSHSDQRTNVVEFRGWISKSSDFQFSISELEKANAGKKFKLVRVLRKELIKDFRTHGLLPGFKLLVTPLMPGETLNLFLIDSAGKRKSLPTSNPNSRRILRNLISNQKFDIQDNKKQNAAFLDTIKVILIPGHSFADNAFVRHPKLFLALIDSQLGSRYRDKFVYLSSEFQVEARWQVIYSLRIPGAELKNNTGLLPISVKRTNPLLEKESYSGIQKLKFIQKGGISFPQSTNEEYLIPNKKWYSETDATIHSGDIICSNGKLVVYEYAADPTLDFVSGHSDYLEYVGGIVFGTPTQPNLALIDEEIKSPDKIVNVEEAIILSGRNDFNWYHWLLEYLPRVIDIPKEINSDVPVLVSSRTPMAGIQILKLLTDRNILTVDPEHVTRVKKLHFRAPALQILDTTMVPWEEALFMDPQLLIKFRNEAIAALKCKETQPSRNIFLVRDSNHRGVRNERKLIEVMEEFGFQIINPAKISVIEQINLFNNARIVIGASGAVMANYVFMQPGTNVIALTSKNLWNFPLPAIICKTFNINFAYLTGRPKLNFHTFAGGVEKMHSDFYISPRKLRKVVSKLISAKQTNSTLEEVLK